MKDIVRWLGFDNKCTYTNQAHQDQLDAATIYSILERDYSLYFAKEQGYSRNGYNTLKFIRKIAHMYTTKRMLDDYIERFITKKLKEVSCYRQRTLKAKEITLEREVSSAWDSIEI